MKQKEHAFADPLNIGDHEFGRNGDK
jgi:hypothetical protein